MTQETSDPGMNRSEAPSRKAAWRFVVAMGVVSLFADMTYEGARSIIGAYLYQLGAGAVLAGLIGGGAECLGYAVRWLSGRGADSTNRHWLFLYGGYALNLIAVPCLALTGSIGSAAALITAERLGKGVRSPPRDALLARAGEHLGHGSAFGLHEFLDQLGALSGPLIVAALVMAAGYKAGFAILAVPAVAALLTLVAAQRLQIRPRVRAQHLERLPRTFWLWIVFVMLATAGFAHFTLVAFDLAAMGFGPAFIPVLFAVAMASEGLTALVLGRLSDRRGFLLLAGFPLCGLIGTAFLFLGSAWVPWAGAVIWGAGLGIQGAVVRAQVARSVSEGRRGAAFGLLDTMTGVAWLGGSVLLGGLYTISPEALTALSTLLELAALAWLVFYVRRKTANAA